MEDQELLRQFEDCSLPAECFHHADHIRVAWLYLRQYSLLQALGKMSEGLRRFAASKGKADRYHETITWSYVFLVFERIERQGREQCWEVFAAANPDLLDWRNNLLGLYYRKETIDSDLARRSFVLPDLKATERI